MSESNEKGVKILVADDDPTSRRLLGVLLRRSGHEVVETTDGMQAMQRFDETFSLAVLDLDMPKASGLDCMRFLHKNYPDIPIIFVSSAGIDDVVRLMKEGAFWFLPKPIDGRKLNGLVSEALKRTEGTAKAVNGKPSAESSGKKKESVAASAPASSSKKAPLIGSSMAVKQLLAKVDRLSSLKENVLISGESGTGKSTLARYIHQKSENRDGAFVSVSCAALPKDLLEAELFGHEKGAFTGAVASRAGRAELAHNGTLFLDEIGDMPLELQPKLLTFLEEREITRIGSNETKKVDVRIIAATLKDLSTLSDQGGFRSDLFFRLNVLNIHIPPLRDRKEDIPEIARGLLVRISSRRQTGGFEISDEALATLADYDWPGNVRELENVLERASAFCKDRKIDLADLIIDEKRPAPDEASSQLLIGGLPLDEVERRAIIETLKLTNGNKAAAARKLEISERSIYNKLKRLNIEA